MMKILIFLISILSLSEISAQDFRNYFYYPRQIPSAKYVHLISFATANLPEDFVEEGSTMIRGPLFGYQASYGLPHNFSAEGNFTTNIVTFQLSMGPKWRYKIDENWALSLGFDFSYVYGQLREFGYDTSIKTWMSYPNVSLGYKLSKFAVSLKVEGIFIADLKTKQDDVELAKEYDGISGVSFGVYIEQPLWKDNYLTLGLKYNYTEFYYPAWAVFPTFDRVFWIPEFFIGLAL
jgi:hypothetical protein